MIVICFYSTGNSILVHWEVVFPDLDETQLVHLKSGKSTLNSLCTKSYWQLRMVPTTEVQYPKLAPFWTWHALLHWQSALGVQVAEVPLPMLPIAMQATRTMKERWNMIVVVGCELDCWISNNLLIHTCFSYPFIHISYLACFKVIKFKYK